MLMPGPMYHNGPFITAFGGLQIGAPLVLMPKFDAEATLREVERHRATWLYLVPTMMGRIWRLPEEVRAQVRRVVAEDGLAPRGALPGLAEGRMDQVARRRGDLGVVWRHRRPRLHHDLSGTEWLTHRGSVGRVAAGGIMKAFGPDGDELPVGQTGEIYMKRDAGSAGELSLCRRHAARHQRRLGIDRRYRLVRRRRLSLSRRPAHRHDPGRRRERLSGGDRGGAGGTSAGRVERGDRPAGRRSRQPRARHRPAARGARSRGPANVIWPSGS